jgi:hypothetical protein
MMFRDFIWHAYDETDNIRLLRILYTVNTNSLLLMQERRTEGTHADSHSIRALDFSLGQNTSHFPWVLILLLKGGVNMK